MFRAIMISLALTVFTWGLWSFGAKADETYRPVQGYDQQVDRTISLTDGVFTASSATTARHIEAVRLSCSAACWIAVSASNGASMANFISGSHLPANGEITYRTNGGDYVIGIGDGGAVTVYVQELTR